MRVTPVCHTEEFRLECYCSGKPVKISSRMVSGRSRLLVQGNTAAYGMLVGREGIREARWEDGAGVQVRC